MSVRPRNRACNRRWRRNRPRRRHRPRQIVRIIRHQRARLVGWQLVTDLPGRLSIVGLSFRTSSHAFGCFRLNIRLSHHRYHIHPMHRKLGIRQSIEFSRFSLCARRHIPGKPNWIKLYSCFDFVLVDNSGSLMGLVEGSASMQLRRGQTSTQLSCDFVVAPANTLQEFIRRKA